MEIKRFYIDKDIINGKNVIIDGDEFNHITKVLRHKIGYKIIVCNNCDQNDYYCTITEIGKESLKADIYDVVPNLTASDIKLGLFQAMPKGDKLDLIVQKAVELGVSEITPFISDYVNENKFNYERINKINIEACKQCGRSLIATVNQPISLNELIDKVKNYEYAIFAYEKENDVNLKDFLSNIGKNVKSLAVIVGSEGGFSESESLLLRQNNIASVSMGKRIMRCETASIVLCGIVMYELGEMDIK